MRWKVKPTPPTPMINEVRYVMKFAWRPKKSNDEIVWLERYLARERYQLTTDLFTSWPYYGWVEV